MPPDRTHALTDSRSTGKGEDSGTVYGGQYLPDREGVLVVRVCMRSWKTRGRGASCWTVHAHMYDVG